VTAVGLERRTTANQCAFHRIDPDLAAQAGSAVLVVHSRSLAPHPVACRGPCLPRQRREVRFKLSRYRKDASHRLLQPTFIKRALCGLLDSRLRPRLPPACAWCLRDRHRVELRLTANLQLQPPPQLPIQAFSAVDRACDVASDALCDDPVGPLDPPPPPPRQRRRFPRIRTPSIAESPLGPKPRKRARRLLQPKHPASTTTRSTDPRAPSLPRACAFALRSRNRGLRLVLGCR
jgi:hypothetical protein